MNHRSKGQLMCRLEGCPHEVLFKAVDGGGYVDPLERRASGIRDRNNPLQGRGSPAGGPGGYGHQHRYSNAGADDETCTQLKPAHDSVCAYHARCPVPECNQARLQYLDPAYESRHSDTGPMYQRWEYCADHKCTIRRCPRRKQSAKAIYCKDHGCQADGCKSQRLDSKHNCCEEHQCKQDGCGTIVEGKFSYCAIHIKCDISNCNRARHNVSGTKDYLRFCTDHATCAVNRCTDLKIEQSLYCANHTCRERGCSKSSQSKPFCSEHCCAEVNCRSPRPWAASPNARGKFCPLHTCRAQDCPEFVDRLAIFCRTHGCSKPKCHEEVIVEGFCLDHLKAHYITQGELKARGGSSSSSKDSSTTLITRPGPGPVAANLQPPNFPRRLSQQSIASIRPGPGQRPTSVLLHGHAHEILIPPDEHPDELLDNHHNNPVKFLDHQHQAHVDDPDPDLDDDEVDDHLPNLNPSSLNSHLSHISHHINQSHQTHRSQHKQDYNNPHDIKETGSGRSSRSSEAVSALSDGGDIGAGVNGSLVNGGGSPGDPPEYSKVASSIVSVGQGHDGGEVTKTGNGGGGGGRGERERERNRRAEREGTGGGVPGSFGGEGLGKGEDSDGW
ncbi:hypothetical protein B0H65DRAFT_573224 [Neurospora tetraspora]|uniref:Uncharacterized protein n=1 Tax=Neurospora tetraspora TaxID=94610 RepID=A0AAE0JF18_9PEZI|nr:hypothetical protein B0H65DRAFT_573224 [Neurospora tetraspora]